MHAGSDVRRGARPRPFPRLTSHSGTHGVEFNVTHRRQEMPRIQRAGPEAILPEMATPAMTAVLFERVMRVSLGHCMRHRACGSRDHDQVDVVCHQAPSEYTEIVAKRMFGKELKIAGSISREEEYILAVISSLRNVVGDARLHKSGATRHAV
jgi:hypothetical protein